MPLPLQLNDLSLALDRVVVDQKRTRHDHAGARTFVSSYVELAVVDSVRSEWLNRLHSALVTGAFRPSAAPLFDVPKGNGTVRTGCLLSLTDQVVYAACLGSLFPSINTAISWARPAKDCAYQLTNTESRAWMRPRFLCWDDFRERSTNAIDAGTSLVAVTDIAAFYDSISLELLASDLRAAGGDATVVDLLIRCLNKWAVVNGRGIPQGFSASDLLAKLYLNVVDKALADSGISHIRFVDDFRFFSSTRGQAKLALLELAQLVRGRGLNLVGSKTHILTPADAKRKFEGAIPTLLPLRRRYVREIAERANIDPSGLSMTDAERLLDARGIDAPTEVLRTAYEANFLERRDDFDKTLFHFLLARLAKANDDFAADNALSLLREHPEETVAVLDYVGKVRDVSTAEGALLDLLASGEAVYPYQQYQILSWRVLFDEPPSERLLSHVRQAVRSASAPTFLRTSAGHLLAKFGAPSDIDYLASSYPAAATEHQRAEVLCSIYRMERGRRNAVLGQARDDAFLTSAAVQLVRQERIAVALGGAA